MFVKFKILPSCPLLHQIISFQILGIFTIEIIVKMISFGLVLGHPACYLRDKLNVIDSVVVLLSLINILLHTLNINPPLHLRVLRVLRVFRGLKVSKDLQHVVNCLVSTLAKIFNYFLLYMLLLLIYAVIGKISQYCNILNYLF